ncbi:hypothetical protein GQ44DRAFT_632189 [Phaeosphaeriaceae sp. PMI808]|nr:hypothetical protein GQ44DRAFT_637806 [Phaeosphaeriaceae sp. PMI808]KAH8701261.1 hypothetical protein GQ44DRAFT_632189 [Phaeosphaeriaceae sp. PMI808]
MAGKVALITGANGITGTAILDYLVRNTTSSQWSQIIVTSRHPLKTHSQDSRITFVALDFLQEPSKLASDLAKVADKVTHAYFSSYVHRDDFSELSAANSSLFENFLSALTKVAPNLENVTLQTGGKCYNVHIQPVPWPVREGDKPRVSTADTNNFYYPQEDFLIKSQKGNKWSYNIIRPVAIVGHNERPNGMNTALTYSIYFMICRELGIKAPCAINEFFWNAVDDTSYAPLLAEMTIYISTNPRCANEDFNCTNGDPFSWRYLWPRLATHFGAKTAENQSFEKPYPKEGELQQEFSFKEWAVGKRGIWDKICDRTNTPDAKATFDFATWHAADWNNRRSWTAVLSTTKAAKYGFHRRQDNYESFIETFRRLRSLV